MTTDLKYRNADIRRGIQSAVRQICQILEEESEIIKSKKEVGDIARVSSNHDEEITSIIVDIYSKIGLQGAISIEQGDGISRESTVEFIDGLKIESGFLSPYFADDRQSLVFEGNVYILLVNDTIRTEADVVNFLEFSKMTQRPVILMAKEFESEALSCLVVNRLQKQLKIVAVKAPFLDGEGIMEDISVFTGATLIGNEFEDTNLSRIDPVSVLGKMKKAEFSPSTSVFYADDEDDKIR